MESPTRAMLDVLACSRLAQRVAGEFDAAFSSEPLNGWAGATRSMSNTGGAILPSPRKWILSRPLLADSTPSLPAPFSRPVFCPYWLYVRASSHRTSRGA